MGPNLSTLNPKNLTGWVQNSKAAGYRSCTGPRESPYLNKKETTSWFKIFPFNLSTFPNFLGFSEAGREGGKETDRQMDEDRGRLTQTVSLMHPVGVAWQEAGSHVSLLLRILPHSLPSYHVT